MSKGDEVGMRTIDITTWKRRAHYEYFRHMEYPHFGLVAEVEVGALVEWCRREGRSFYHAMVHTASAAANSVEEFRYRIRADEVVLHEVIHPSFTLLRDDELFDFCPLSFQPDLLPFLEEARSRAAAQVQGPAFGREPEGDDRLFITCIPWVHFTGISHPIAIANCDSVPRLSWGRYERRGAGIFLPFGVQAHHAFVDGLHVGRFFQALERGLAAFGSSAAKGVL